MLPFLDSLPSTIISIFIALVGVVFGVAAKPMLENAIAGFVLSTSKAIRTGDTVIVNEKYGTIEDITMLHTVLKIWNQQRYFVPNSLMLSKEVTNFSTGNHYLWTHVEFYVDIHEDIDKVKELAIEAADACPSNIKEETASFWIMEMSESSVKCWVAAWADSPPHAWDLASEMRGSLMKAFTQHHIKTHRWHIDARGTIPH